MSAPAGNIRLKTHRGREVFYKISTSTVPQILAIKKTDQKEKLICSTWNEIMHLCMLRDPFEKNRPRL
jgi:hypothetical protein